MEKALAWVDAFRTRPGPGGNDRPTVAYVQYGPTKLGYQPGPVDGYSGPLTIEAVKQFQASRSLPEDGEIDEALVQKLLEDIRS